VPGVEVLVEHGVSVVLIEEVAATVRQVNGIWICGITEPNKVSDANS
jgi:hypothetical protein